MTPTQRRLLARDLKALYLALEHGRCPDAEIARLVAKAKHGLDELHADVCAAKEKTPWDWTVEQIEAVTKCHALHGAVSTQSVPVSDFKPQGVAALFAGAGRGLEMSQPVGDR